MFKAAVCLPLIPTLLPSVCLDWQHITSFPGLFWFRCQSSHFKAAPLTAGRPVFQLCPAMTGLCMLTNDRSASGRVIWCLGISLMFGNRSLCGIRPFAFSDWLCSGKKSQGSGQAASLDDHRSDCSVCLLRDYLKLSLCHCEGKDATRQTY